MAGCFPAVPVIDDWQGFDQRLSEIESPWGTNPANGGINSTGKWKGLERLGMLVKGRLVPITDIGDKAMQTFSGGIKEVRMKVAGSSNLRRTSSGRTFAEQDRCDGGGRWRS